MMVLIATDVRAEQKGSETLGSWAVIRLTILITRRLSHCFCAALSWVKNIISGIMLMLTNV